MKNASPAKLKNGAWGARVKSESVQAGEEITISTKAGKSWQATVERVLWHGNGVSVVAIAGPSGHHIHSSSQNGCPRCRQTATRTAQIFEECEYCGTEPIYM